MTLQKIDKIYTPYPVFTIGDYISKNKLLQIIGIESYFQRQFDSM